MIVKPATSWVSTNPDPLFINNVSVVLQSMATNVDIYPKPVPDLPTVQTALDDFKAAVITKATGTHADTARKNNLRLVLATLVRQLAAYVLVACKGDMGNLILSGFPPQKPVHQPVGSLPTPQGVTLGHGTHRGEMAAGCNPVFGASTYNWRLTPDTPGAEPIEEESTGSDYYFTGLTGGVSYKLEVSAMGTAGPSDWSNPAILISD